MLTALMQRINEKKARLDALRPLPPELVKNLDRWLSVELIYNSNAIEGNTLSASETALVVEKGLTIGGKSIVEHLEAINHARALDYIKELTMEKKSIDNHIIKQMHTLVLKGIDDKHSGIWRAIQVRIAGSDVQLAQPLVLPDLMHDFEAWLQNHGEHPVKKAAEAHLRFVTIHPFIDGNGRTARLLMNLMLLQHGYPLTIIKNKDRLAYINALEKAQKTGDETDFLQFIYASVEQSLDLWLEAASASLESA